MSSNRSQVFLDSPCELSKYNVLNYAIQVRGVTSGMNNNKFFYNITFLLFKKIRNSANNKQPDDIVFSVSLPFNIIIDILKNLEFVTNNDIKSIRNNTNTYLEKNSIKNYLKSTQDIHTLFENIFDFPFANNNDFKNQNPTYINLLQTLINASANCSNVFNQEINVVSTNGVPVVTNYNSVTTNVPLNQSVISETITTTNSSPLNTIKNYENKLTKLKSERNLLNKELKEFKSGPSNNKILKSKYNKLEKLNKNIKNLNTTISNFYNSYL